MNEFEQNLIDKFLEGLHALELTLTKELGEVRAEIKAFTEKNESEHKSLRDLVERNIETDTLRLNKHSQELDTLQSDVAKLQEWKTQYQRQVNHRIAISQSITAIGAAVLTFLLTKFL